MIVAIGIAVLGALLTALAPLLGLVTPQRPPAFASWPLLLILGVFPPVLATAFARKQRIDSAAGVLIGTALLVPGRLVLDARLLDDAGLAARPSLLHPHDLAPLAPSIGLWVLLAGHVVSGIAGLVAARCRERVPDPIPGSGFETGALDDRGGGLDSTGTGARNQGLLAAVLFATVPASAGVLMAQFASDDPYLLPKAAVDSPALGLLGALLLAVGVPTAGGWFVSSADPDFARGGLLGLAAAVAGVAVPPLFAAAVLERLHYGWGALLELLSVLVLAWLSIPAGRTSPGDRGEETADVRLPGLSRLLAVSGVLGMLAGVSAVAATAMPQLTMPLGSGEVTPYAAPMLLPAGLAVAIVGAAMLSPRAGVLVRPALPVACAALPLAGAATLDTVLTAAQATGAHAGIGAWATGFAVLLAVAAALVAAVAGGVERDEADLTELSLHRAVGRLSVPAALLALGAFGLPVVTAPDYTPPGVFTGFSTTSWGLVVALVSVLVAVVLAPLCRPARAAALPAGAAVVVLVRVLELPLTAGRAEGSGPGPGLWCGLACLVILLIMSAFAARRGAAEAR
ncbi:hypothetical protein DFQ14_1012 [Halopolyspora algeriensis]|uniref:Uncharacterized protein n=1 Tax=Halopolyspora algeriensis TaxID=1500506 RepID=A0A368VWT8_9ACTN|nr:hypothetical protein [Halopolyspora algeriensis]RCW46666.1 hypothetical protein DFQ14_1012 [Halopolyspora algeriensis]TQM46691.1 hypothetical protein FHU43_3812 [Halopolyspora algeriensis]